ncbi:MAG: 2Fe-2S iron-sulfur cluster-binding protein [Rhodobacteraceae bacterium]|nr:2Fe-2S iron-sulfur cluster-binding protein [Paracoccaceae bacterium]
MILALQIGGGTIVALALFQLCLGVYSSVAAVFRERRLDARHLQHFNDLAQAALRNAEVDRLKSGTTWAGKRKFRIVEKRVENKCGDICSFYLQPHDGGELPPFLPGQFLTFELPISDQPAPVIRCYSLSDSPSRLDRYRVTIKKLPPPPDAGETVPGGLSSTYFHANLKEGDVVDVQAPRGGFVLDLQSERPVVLIGGGVGLTPVLSMLKALDDAGSHREVHFFHAARSGDDIVLCDEIREIAERRNNVHYRVLYSAPTDACVEGRDYDCPGFLTVDVLKRYLASSNYEFYVCGPPQMMSSLTEQLRDWGVPDSDIHFEAFGPASVKTVKSPASSREAAESVQVEFSRSGKKVAWHEQDGTLLDLAERNGIRVASGCRAGNCGTCATALKEGDVTYVTRPASSPAQGSVLMCIACPGGNVILDA